MSQWLAGNTFVFDENDYEYLIGNTFLSESQSSDEGGGGGDPPAFTSTAVRSMFRSFLRGSQDSIGV